MFRQKFFYGFDDLIFKMFSPLYIGFLLGISNEEGSRFFVGPPDGYTLALVRVTSRVTIPPPYIV